VDILVIFGREEHFLWKVCSTIPALGLQNGACSTGGKKGIRFDIILITNWFIFQGVRKLEIMIWRAWGSGPRRFCSRVSIRSISSRFLKLGN
jgi:hypothetical protein